MFMKVWILVRRQELAITLPHPVHSQASFEQEVLSVNLTKHQIHSPNNGDSIREQMTSTDLIHSA
jgi:hypothetical protein